MEIAVLLRQFQDYEVNQRAPFRACRRTFVERSRIVLVFDEKLSGWNNNKISSKKLFNVVSSRYVMPIAFTVGVSMSRSTCGGNKTFCLTIVSYPYRTAKMLIWRLQLGIPRPSCFSWCWLWTSLQSSKHCLVQTLLHCSAACAWCL